MFVRVVPGLALLATGFLAGAIGYGALCLVPTFESVPLEVRLSFHAELMKRNGVVVQASMVIASVSVLTLAFLERGRDRLLAVAAGVLLVCTFLTTRFGNVPINQKIKKWAVGTPPADHAEILDRWVMFNALRTLTAFVAFILLTVLVLDQLRRRATPRTTPRAGEPALAG